MAVIAGYAERDAQQSALVCFRGFRCAFFVGCDLFLKCVMHFLIPYSVWPQCGQRWQVSSLQSVCAHKSLDGELHFFISRTCEGAAHAGRAVRTVDEILLTVRSRASVRIAPIADP